MSYEANQAINASYQFECKKDAAKQLQSGDWKLQFTVSSLDVPMEMFQDAMGQRYMAVLVPIGDDEQAIVKPKNYVAAAQMLCKNPLFWEFCEVESEKEAVQDIYGHCGINSRSELKDGSQAVALYKGLLAQFNDWKAMNRK